MRRLSYHPATQAAGPLADKNKITTLLRASYNHPDYPLISNYLPSVLHATPADAKRINVKSSNDVNYWCRTLNCTETRLRNAVLAVGSLAADVQAYLNR